MITLTEARDQIRQQADVAEKRRKDREREDQAARAEREREKPLTAAHIVGEAMMDGAPSGPAEKAIADRGATAGPGEGVQPGQIEPEDFRRPYVSEGHAARSPQAEAPRTPPLPPAGRGIIRPVELSAAPVVSGNYGTAMAGLAAHQARSAATAGRPPVPGGSA